MLKQQDISKLTRIELYFIISCLYRALQGKALPYESEVKGIASSMELASIIHNTLYKEDYDG